MTSSASLLKYFGFIGVNVTIENLYLDNINIDSNKIKSTKYECFIENRGTIKNLYIDKTKVNYPVNKYAFIRNIDGVINNFIINEMDITGGANIYYQNKGDYNQYLIINNLISSTWDTFNLNASTIVTINNFIQLQDRSVFKFNNSSNTYKINGVVLNVTTPSRDVVSNTSVGTILKNGSINPSWS